MSRILLVGTHIMPQIDLQQAIHPLCLAIRLRVEASGEVQVRLMSLKSSVQNLPVKRPSRSLTIVVGKPQYFTTCFRNNRAVISAGHLAGTE